MSRQLELPLRLRDEIPKGERSVEAPTATHGCERLGASDLMERVSERANYQASLQRVRNKGIAGFDGMTVDESPEHLRTHWSALLAQLLLDTYQPSPVRRQAIPNSGGGMRELRIPTVFDRFSQQSNLQLLGPRFDILTLQLWFSTQTQRPRCSRASSAVCEQRPPFRVGRGFGEILRPRAP